MSNLPVKFFFPWFDNDSLCFFEGLTTRRPSVSIQQQGRTTKKQISAFFHNRNQMNEHDLVPDDSNVTIVNEQATKGKALSRLKRELSDEDLASPGAQKLLIDRLEKAEEDLLVLDQLRVQFHDVDKELAVAHGKLHRNISIEILSGGTIAIGGAAIGLSSTNIAFLAFGILLTVIGIVVKARGL